MAKKQIPLKEGLFALPRSASEKGHLLGSKCKHCGQVFFPQRIVCLRCGRRGLEEVALSSKGKLHTFTVVEQTPPGSLVSAPYGLGSVKLAEGVFVDTVLAVGDLKALRTGMEVELVIEKVKADEEGNEVMAYKFRPV